MWPSFFSGCLIAVSPFKEDFGGTLTPVFKTMMGLEDYLAVEGEVTV